MSACCEIGNVLSAKGGARVEVLKQVIRLMKRIEGAFCPWSYLDQMDYFQQGGCNEEEAYAYANSNMAICQVLSTLSDVGQPFSKPADQSRYYNL